MSDLRDRPGHRSTPPPESDPPRSGFAAVRFHLLWIVPALAFAAYGLRQDRSTVERGNRLYRDGDAVAAAEIYRDVMDAEDTVQVAERPVYNLGTVLLSDRDPRATRYLERAATASEAAGEAETLQRAHYNLGYGYLSRLRPDLSQDSALVFVTASITHSRAALHQDPTDEDARWNLAVAQRSLDSLLLNMANVDVEVIEGDVEDGVEFDDGMLSRAESSEPDAMPPPEGLPPDPEQDAEQEEADQQASVDGAREALSGDDPGPIGPAEAREILSGFDEDPGMMVRGILWIHRPDINWWEFTPYPGGDW